MRSSDDQKCLITILFFKLSMSGKLILLSLTILFTSIIAMNLIQSAEAGTLAGISVSPESFAEELNPGESISITKDIFIVEDQLTNTEISVDAVCDEVLSFSFEGDPMSGQIEETVMVDESAEPGTYICVVTFVATFVNNGGSTFSATQDIEITVPEPTPIEVTGMYHIIWPHPDPEFPPDVPSAPGHTLTNAESFQLLGVAEAAFGGGGPHKFNGKVVTVIGILDPETNQILVQTIELPIIEPPASHILGSHVTGSQPWVTLLCKFADSSTTEPENLNYFEDELDLMDDYWREVSYENINLVGSVEQDWETMAQDRIDYLDDPATHFVGHTLNWDEIAADCADAHDANVFFPDFDGINFIFNQPLDGYSWGGGVDLTNDVILPKSYDATWMSPGGWGNQDVLGQEMGHGFGLPHSSGPYTATYDSQWDVQSAGGTCDVPDADFNCLGVHTVSVHKDALGWIDAADIYNADASDDQEVFIERLADPTDLANPDVYLGAQIPIGGNIG